MKKCYILIGIQASGKSTWIKDNNLNDNEDYEVASIDKVITDVSARYGLTYSETFLDLARFSQKVFEQHLKQVIVDRTKSIIIDRTNLTPNIRRRFIKNFKNAGYQIIGVYFQTPEKAEWIRRLESRGGKIIPPEALEKMANNFTIPTLDEGFDEIIPVATDRPLEVPLRQAA